MADLDTTIFKAYDIRGLYPDQINEDVMENIVRAIYTFLAQKIGKNDFSMVLGHDMRLSSPALHTIARQTLSRSGAHVVDVGLVATPTVYFALKTYGYDAAIQISASHNPKEYNGIKIVRRDGDALVKIGAETGMAKIVEIVKTQAFAPFTEKGTVEKLDNVLTEEIKQAVEAIPVGDVGNITVVADPANAMGILPLTELFTHLAARLIPMNFELDGTFPAHQADPLQHKTLHDLQKKVTEKHADMGIAIDGDADRVMFIDEKGAIVPATLITTLVAGEILRQRPKARILVDIRYIRNVEDMVRKMGGEVGYTKVGHALITAQVNEEGAAFAGESSGHYYFRSMGGCESTMRIILYILAVLSREKKPFSAILNAIQTSVESGEVNFELKGETNAKQIMDAIKHDYADGELSTLDGVAVTYPDWRFSVRSSNTEPLVRLNLEGKTEALVNDTLKKLTTYICQLGAEVKI